MKSTKKRKRRLRKKLFLDEFTVLAFELRLNLSTSAAEEELDFLDRLIDKLESMDLCYIGHFLDNRLRGHIIAKGRYNSPTEGQRLKLLKWCDNHPRIVKQQVGELVDGNYL